MKKSNNNSPMAHFSEKGLKEILSFEGYVPIPLAYTSMSLPKLYALRIKQTAFVYQLRLQEMKRVKICKSSPTKHV